MQNNIRGLSVRIRLVKVNIKGETKTLIIHHLRYKSMLKNKNNKKCSATGNIIISI